MAKPEDDTPVETTPKATFRRLAGGLASGIIGSGLGSLAIKVAYVGLQLVIGIILARTLGPTDYGVYSFALSIVAVLGILAQLGFPPLAVRLTAVYRIQDKAGRLNEFIRSAVKTLLVSSLLIAALAVVSILGFGIIPVGMPRRPLLLSLILIPFLALLALSTGALRGLGHVVLGQVPDQLARPFLLSVFLVLAGVTFSTLSVEAAVIANLCATLAALVLGWFLWSRKLSLTGPRVGEPGNKPESWLAEATPFCLLALAQVANHQADIVMLGFLTQNETVGVYRVGVQVADSLGMGLVALSAVVAPELASLYAKGDWVTLQKILVWSHRVSVAVLFPISIVLSLAALPLLAFVFGDLYTPAAGPMSVLLLGKAGYAAVGFSGLALSMFGRATVAAVFTGITASGNVVLNLALIPHLGMIGAALATAISAVAVNAVSLVWMYRKYGLDFSLLGLKARRQ